MKVLIATKEGQGKRKNDFSHTKEGNCKVRGETVDGGCGCRRSMAGFETLKATTTFEVKDIDISRTEFSRLLESEKRAGWYSSRGMSWGEEEMERDAKEVADELLDLAKTFPTGAVLEKRGNRISVR